MNHFPILLLRNLHAPCASQARTCVLCAKLLQCCCPRRWPARDPGAMQCQTNSFLILHIALFIPCTSHFTLALHLNSSHLSSSHLISCLPIRQLSSSWVYCKACTKYFPVLLCTTKLAQSTSQYYFALQSLQKLLPSTTTYYKACRNCLPILLCTTKLAPILPSATLYYKTCTKYFPVLLCTTKLAQSTSQCYFVLQSLRKILPSTTLYYKACTNHFPAILCTTQSLRPVLLYTTKLAKNTSQYYFVLRSLRKALPRLLCTTKLAQGTCQYYFVIQSLHKESLYTQQILSQRSCYTQQAF